MFSQYIENYIESDIMHVRNKPQTARKAVQNFWFIAGLILASLTLACISLKTL